MKAMVYHSYGSPEILGCEEIARPIPGDDQVLIKIRAASVNPLDVGMMKGRPYLFRLLFGLPKPKVTRPGRDVAGLVEEVGKNVTQFKPGDEVFGVCTAGGWMKKTDGAFAEYACTFQSAVVMKPGNVTFEQAASAPVAAITALQGLRDRGKVQPGQKVLIHGAGGGVGTFAVQIAKAFGAEVTAVSSTKNLEMLRSIGADHIIDYTRDNFTKGMQRYDLIFDCFATHSLQECRRVLNPTGIYIGVGGPPSIRGLLASGITALLLSKFGAQKFVTFLAKVNTGDLELIGEFMATGEIRPVIDKATD